jgi:hypothetical protein
MSDFLDKAKDLAAEHGDKVVDAVDKVTDVVDDKSGGKLTSQLDAVDSAAESAIDKLQGQ